MANEKCLAHSALCIIMGNLITKCSSIENFDEDLLDSFMDANFSGLRRDLRNMYKMIVEYYNIDDVVADTIFDDKSCSLHNLGWMAKNVFYYSEHAPMNAKPRFCLKLSDVEYNYGSVRARRRD